MKTQPTTTQGLRNLITALENKEATQKREMQESFTSLLEDLKPVNLIKNIGRSVFSGSNKDNLQNSLIGLGTGKFIRNLFVGNTNNFIGKWIQWGTAGIVAKKVYKIKLKAIKLILILFPKRNGSKLPEAVQSEGIQGVKMPGGKKPELIKLEHIY